MICCVTTVVAMCVYVCQGGELLSLRYDLTVPFARFIAMHNCGYIKVCFPLRPCVATVLAAPLLFAASSFTSTSAVHVAQVLVALCIWYVCSPL
jgi:hypothetical protein